MDVLLVFNWADFARFRDEIALAEDAVVLHASGDAIPIELIAGTRLFVPVPFDQLAKE